MMHIYCHTIEQDFLRKPTTFHFQDRLVFGSTISHLFRVEAGPVSLLFHQNV